MKQRIVLLFYSKLYDTEIQVLIKNDLHLSIQTANYKEKYKGCTTKKGFLNWRNDGSICLQMV